MSESGENEPGDGGVDAAVQRVRDAFDHAVDDARELSDEARDELEDAIDDLEHRIDSLRKRD